MSDPRSRRSATPLAANTSICAVHRLGLVPYEEAWRLQERLAQEVARGERPPTLLLLEHPHTYTFGRKGHADNLLWDEAELARRGVQVFWVDRGGDVTYHGPGQLVGYPLLPLGGGKVWADPQSGRPRLPQADFLGYLRDLEQTLISALARLGVASSRVSGLTGVWIQSHVPARCTDCPPEPHRSPAKIAAIGVKVDARGVTRHGFALNVAPDMSYWDGIVGCGLRDYPVTSLAQLLDPAPSMERVADAVVAAFGEVFGFSVRLAPVWQ